MTTDLIENWSELDINLQRLAIMEAQAEELKRRAKALRLEAEAFVKRHANEMRAEEDGSMTRETGHFSVSYHVLEDDLTWSRKMTKEKIAQLAEELGIGGIVKKYDPVLDKDNIIGMLREGALPIALGECGFSMKTKEIVEWLVRPEATAAE